MNDLLVLTKRLLSFNAISFCSSVGLLFLASMLEGAGFAVLAPLFDALIKSGASFWVHPIPILGTSIAASNAVVVICAIYIAKGCTTYLQSVVFNGFLYSYEAHLRDEYISAFLGADWGMISGLDSGRSAALVNVHAKLVTECIYFFNWMLRSVLMISTLVVVALAISWEMTFVMGVTFIVGVLPLRSFLKRAVASGEGISMRTESLAREAQGILTNAKDILCSDRQIDASQQFRRESGLLASELRRARINEDASRAMLEPVMVIALLGLLVFGLTVMGLSPGVLLAFMGVCYRIMPPSSYLFQQYQRVLAGLQPHVEILGSIQELKSNAAAPGGTIERGGLPVRNLKFNSVHLTFPGTEEAILAGVDFEVRAGEHLCIVGESGSGKSTCLDLLLQLIQPTGGELSVDSHLLRDLNVSQWRREVAYVGQSSFLFNGTLEENLLWGVEQPPQRVELEGLLRDVGLGAFCGASLDRSVGERGGKLSGGERQRIALVRALLRNPRVLLLDEVTSALDDGSELKCIKLVERFLAANSVIVLSVAHKTAWQRSADRVLRLSEGTIQFQRTKIENSKQ